jgi:hypothetical protein
MASANRVVFSLTGTSIDANEGWIGGLADATTSLSSYPGSTGVSLGVQSNTSGGCGGTCTYGSGGVSVQSGLCHIADNGHAMYLAVNFNNGHVFCGDGCSAWANSGSPDGDTGFIATLAGSTTYFVIWAGIQLGSAAPVAQIDTNPSLGGCSNASTFVPWG